MSLRQISRNRHKAFTLAELLIALAILGVIATFTIPKVLQAQQDSKFSSIAKEAAGTISASFDAYRQQNTVTSATHGKNLTPYMNYVSYDTASFFDAIPGQTTWQCSAALPCIHLHNGALIFFPSSFAGTTTTNMIQFIVDPDGIVTNGGAANGPGKSVDLILYTTGRMTTYGRMIPGSIDNNNSNHNGTPADDPSWFSWN